MLLQYITWSICGKKKHSVLSLVLLQKQKKRIFESTVIFVKWKFIQIPLQIEFLRMIYMSRIARELMFSVEQNRRNQWTISLILWEDGKAYLYPPGPLSLYWKETISRSIMGLPSTCKLLAELLRRNVYWIPFKQWQLHTSNSCHITLILHFVASHELIIVGKCKWKWFLPVTPTQPSPSVTVTWERSQRKKLKYDLKVHNSMRSFLSCSIN